MTARKLRRRRKAPKATLIPICGHMLTKEQHDEFRREFDRRRELRHENENQSEQHALNSVLYHASASVRAHEQLGSMALYRRASNALLTLGSLKDGMLYQAGDQKLIDLYDAILGHVAAEFQAVSQELGAMHEAITVETMGKEAQS